MSDEILEKVKSILNQMLKDVIPEVGIKPEDTLLDLSINSITFIKVVIIIESEFGFEFEDEDLNINKFKTVMDIVDYIEEKV